LLFCALTHGRNRKSETRRGELGSGATNRVKRLKKNRERRRLCARAVDLIYTKPTAYNRPAR